MTYVLCTTRSSQNRRSAQTWTVAVLLIVIAAMGITLSIETAFGDQMTSGHYKIQTDSLNFGGVRSTSSSYSIEDTGGEVATGYSSSTNYMMSAGYQQMPLVNVSVTAAANVTMSPSLGGVTGGTSNGATSFTATTDDAAGYTATIQASSSPALVGPYGTFADYAPAGGSVPDFNFSVAATASAFGFSPEGTDIATKYKNNGSACNTGVNTSSGCWDGLSTSPKTILSRTTSNQPTGTLTTIRFKAATGSSHIQPDGTYIATTTVTIIPN